jgi:hypothetical protein
MAILGALMVIQHTITEDYDYIRSCITDPDDEHYWSELRWLSICDALNSDPSIPEELQEEAKWQLEAAHQLRRFNHGYGES